MLSGRNLLAVVALATAGAALALVGCAAFAPAETPGTMPDGGGDSGTTVADGGTPEGGDGATSADLVTIASSTLEIPWLTLDATRVIWMTGKPEGDQDGELFACSRTACDKPITLKTPIAPGYFASVDGVAFVGHAFGGDGIARIDPAGPVKLAPVGSVEKVYAMVGRAGSLYYALFNTPAEYGRSVNRFDVGTNAVAKIADYPSGTAANTGAMAVGTQRVFLGARNTGEIVSAPMSGGVFSSFRVNDDAFAYSMAAGDTNVFWVNADDLASCSATAPTCAAITQEIPKNPTNGTPRTVTLYGGKLFVQTSLGDLWQCDEASCAGSRKVIHHDATFHIVVDGAKNVAVDDEFIWYVARVGAEYRVMRLKRNTG